VYGERGGREPQLVLGLSSHRGPEAEPLVNMATEGEALTKLKALLALGRRGQGNRRE